MGLLLSFPRELFGATSHYESYAYTTIRQYGSWSVRQYSAAVAAETSGGRGDNSGFGTLARYIGVFSTPENSQGNPVAMTTPVVSTPIAMTTPVVSKSSGTQGSSMRFVLPSVYQQVSDAPVPTSSRVNLVAIPARQMAAFTFSGHCDGVDEAAEKYDELVALMKGSGWKPAGQWELHRHNPPYTIGPFRTNEVLVDVTQDEGS